MVGVPRPPLKSCNRATALAGALSASTAMGLRRLSSLLLLRLGAFALVTPTHTT